MDRVYDMRLEKLFVAIQFNSIAYVEKCFKTDVHGKSRFHIDARDSDLNTPLLMAAYYDRIEIAQMLLKKNARVDEGNMLGITPLMVACSIGSIQMVHLLVKHGATFGVSDLGQTCLGFACANGHLDVVKYLVAAGHELTAEYDVICPSHLMMATMFGHEEVIMYLCLSSLNGSTRLARLPEDARNTVTQLLLETANQLPAVDIDAPCPTFFNINVLTFAAILHKRRIFEVLLELGADFYYRLPSGNTVDQIAEVYDFGLNEFGFAVTMMPPQPIQPSVAIRRSVKPVTKNDSPFKHIKAILKKLFHIRK
uniref:ANK_REP_REGION domain-containing protein n=1 Tax=Panagrellus redivivus TaxID=6233 RepID=A0A7E4V5F4_PANRE